MYQQMVYYNRMHMHVKTRLSQSLLSVIVMYIYELGALFAIAPISPNFIRISAPRFLPNSVRISAPLSRFILFSEFRPNLRPTRFPKSFPNFPGILFHPQKIISTKILSQTSFPETYRNPGPPPPRSSATCFPSLPKVFPKSSKRSSQSLSKGHSTGKQFKSKVFIRLE